MLRRVFPLSLLCALSILPAASLGNTAGDAGDVAVGYVKEVTGPWSLTSARHPPRKVRAGMALPGGTILKAGSKQASIRILFFDGSACSTPPGKSAAGPIPSCGRIRKLPEPPEEDKSLAERMLIAARRFFTSPEPTYVATLSREIPAHPLQEAVLSLGDPGIDLGPVLASPLEGPRRLLFQRRSGRKPGDWQTVREETVKASSMPASGFAPGLYRVWMLGTASSQDEPAGAEAWLLLAPPQAYPQAAGSFNAAKKVVEGWSALLDAEQGRGLLRAYLEQMAVLQGSGATD